MSDTVHREDLTVTVSLADMRAARYAARCAGMDFVSKVDDRTLVAFALYTAAQAWDVVGTEGSAVRHKQAVEFVGRYRQFRAGPEMSPALCLLVEAWLGLLRRLAAGRRR